MQKTERGGISRGASGMRWKNMMAVIYFVAPALLVYGTYNLFGVFRTFCYSMLDWNGLRDGVFVGLSNYIRLIQDRAVWDALKNNLILVMASVCVQLPGALILAVLINSKLRLVKLFRTLWFMPVLLSTVATGILWVLIYDPVFGLLASALKAAGMGSLVRGWLGDSSTALYSVLAVICWQYIPFYMIILKAGLANISLELQEAAYIDGASRVQCFFRVTIPLLMPTIRTAALLNIVGSLKYFDLIYVMTGGGPNGATELLATYLYKKGFVGWEMGYASSIAGFMFLFCAAFACLYMYLTREQEG